jgi:uncharacterized membrane protein
MQDTRENSGPVTARWVKVLLGLSLAVNLAVAGMVAGIVLRHDGGRERQDRVAPLAAFGAPYMKALPRDDRRAVLRSLRAGEAGPLPDRAARRAMFLEVVEVLRARPFEPQALAEAVSRQSEASVAAQQRVQDAWLGVVGAMSQEERMAYADAVEALLDRGRSAGRTD